MYFWRKEKQQECCRSLMWDEHLILLQMSRFQINERKFIIQHYVQAFYGECKTITSRYFEIFYHYSDLLYKLLFRLDEYITINRKIINRISIGLNRFKGNSGALKWWNLIKSTIKINGATSIFMQSNGVLRDFQSGFTILKRQLPL